MAVNVSGAKYRGWRGGGTQIDFFCHTDSTDFSASLRSQGADAGFLIRLLASLFAAINLIQRSSSPLRGSRDLVNLIN